MAEAVTIVREPTEKLKSFNERIRALCQDTAWTSARLDIVDGQPVVTLMAEEIEATDEHVSVGLAEEAGAVILEGPAIEAAVLLMRCTDARSHAKTEEILERIYEVAGDAVIEEMTGVVQGERYIWGKHPDSGEPVYIPEKVSYMLIVWEQLGDEEGDDEEGDGGGDGEETTLDEDGRVIDAEATVIREPRPSRRRQQTTEEPEEPEEPETEEEEEED